MQTPDAPRRDPARVGYLDVDPAAGGAAARGWWDAEADAYVAEHGTFLGPDAGTGFVWGPEGLREDDAHLLGDVAGRDVLEVGAGAAQCSRWVRRAGGRAVATDVSLQMLRAARAGTGEDRLAVPLVQADARSLPFADASFDVVFTSFGALPFVPDAARVHREAARVLRPAGRWVFSVTHPLRWAFPDDPGERGLTATRSYFDRRPYVELDDHGEVLYAEYHRTLGDHVRDVVGAGLVLEDLVEPEWPATNTQVWGGWGPVRGRYLPGTAVLVARRP